MIDCVAQKAPCDHARHELARQSHRLAKARRIPIRLGFGSLSDFLGLCRPKFFAKTSQPLRQFPVRGVVVAFTGSHILVAPNPRQAPGAERPPNTPWKSARNLSTGIAKVKNARRCGK